MSKKPVSDRTWIDGVEKDFELCDGCKIKQAEYLDQFPMYKYLKNGCKGPLPVIAVRFNYEGWLFLMPEMLEDSGKNWVVSLQNAKLKGKRFGQFFENVQEQISD